MNYENKLLTESIDQAKKAEELFMKLDVDK